MSAEAIVQRQLDAYNAQDLEAFCACFADDCVLAEYNGAVTGEGAEALRARYRTLFADYPDNRARLINRIVVGDVVVDHEDIARTRNGARFRAAAMYTVRDGRIARVDFVREEE
jgi:uncharacterized protein (TIGR02246 family)